MNPKMTAVKAWVAAIGTTATAVATAVAAAQVALADGKLDFTEYGTIATAIITLGATIYAVWRAPNKTKGETDAVRDSERRG